MHMSLPFGRLAVAACILLSACAAGPGSGAPVAATQPDPALGAFLAARYADSVSDPASAARFYATALKADPGNQELAEAGFLAGVLAGSPEALQLAPRLPGNALAALLSGNQAAMNGDYGQAAQFFKSLPGDQLAALIEPLLLAWTRLGQGNEQAALNGLTASFNKAGFGAVYVLNAAMIADSAGDRKTAAQLYGAVSGAAPNLRLAEILASWYTRQGDKARAQAVLADLVATHPDLAIALPQIRQQMNAPVISTPVQGLAEAYLTLAASLSQPQAMFLRTVFLRFSLQLRPDLSAARLILANTQINGDDPSYTPTPTQMENALTTLAPIQPTDPLYGPAAAQEASLYASLNQPDKAVALLDGLIASHPHNPGLLASAGDVWRSASQCGQALPYYQKAIAMAGTPPPAEAWTLYFDRGICEDQTGNWAAAEPDIETALRLSPDQPYVLNYLGYSWAKRDVKLDQAKAMLEKAAALDPNDGAVLDSLGYVELKRGNTKSALALLIQAVQLSPDDAEVNAHLGDAFWQAGQSVQAAYQWDRALDLNPDPTLKAGLEAKINQHFATQTP